MAVTLTEAAAKHVAAYLAKRGKGFGLRLGVKTSGCSGMAYKLEFADAVNMLRMSIDDYAGDTLLVRAFSTNSADWAGVLIKAHQPDSAIAVVDSALVFERDNRNLL